MQNSAGRQELSLGSAFTSLPYTAPYITAAAHSSPAHPEFSPVPAPGRSDLVLPASTENVLRAQKMLCEHRKLPPVTQRILARQGGLPAASQHTQTTGAHTTPYSVFVFYYFSFTRKAGSELGTALTWKAKLLKFKCVHPGRISSGGIMENTLFKQALKHTGFHLEV